MYINVCALSEMCFMQDEWMAAKKDECAESHSKETVKERNVIGTFY